MLMKILEKLGVIKYYEHVSVLDGRTSIDICVPRDGRKYYVKFDEIKGSNRPPLHFNCRSQLVPRTKENNGTELRASQSGQIPNEKYGSWFEKQSDSFKRDALGKSRYNLYKKGAWKVQSLPDVVSGKKRTLKQYQDSLFRVVKS